MVRSSLIFCTFILILTQLLLGCGKTAATIRKFTYPPDFKYMEAIEIKSAMWRLARDVQELNQILRNNGVISQEMKEEVVRLLTSMENTAAEIDPQGRSTNHPLIDRNIEALRRDFAMAREATKQEPPNFFLAGSVAGSCLYCHKEPT